MSAPRIQLQLNLDNATARFMRTRAVRPSQRCASCHGMGRIALYQLHRRPQRWVTPARWRELRRPAAELRAVACTTCGGAGTPEAA